MLPSLKKLCLDKKGVNVDHEGLCDLLEIQHGISALGDRICSNKQLSDVKKIQRMIQKLDSRIIRVFQREIKKPLRHIIFHPDEW